MMFWDSSALVPLIVQQTSSDELRKLLGQDSALLCWILSEVEVMSALARLKGEKALPPEGFRQACEQLELVWGADIHHAMHVMGKWQGR